MVALTINPRFAPSCRHETMCELAKLQQENGAMAQTHVSENMGEVLLVKDMFSSSQHYVDVYDTAGLLGPEHHLCPCCPSKRPGKTHSEAGWR